MKAFFDRLFSKISQIFQNKKSRRIAVAVISAVLVVLASVLAFLIYTADYYRADGEAISAFASGMGEKITVTREKDRIICTPEGARAGLIFYPGGKVEYTTYEPLMIALAELGIKTVLLKMPCNLAVLDMNAADGVREEFPEIDDWYIGGHSLGGSMAAAYLEKHTDDFLGLVLLGSYSTANLSKTNLSVISIYGAEDGVMNREKYAECKANLPDSFTEYVIDGGSHAYFAMYGEQEGDGVASITREEQIWRTAEQIARVIILGAHE